MICSVMFLVIGCAVGPDYRTPKVSAPGSWSTSQQNGTINSANPVVHWWKTFNDPLLDSLIIRAMKSNLDLREAEARIREARFLSSAVSAELWPSVNTSASYSRSRRSLGISTIPPSAKLKRNLYQAGFDASWEIDLFGGKRRAREAARADVDAAVENQRDVLITLLAEVARNYIEVRGIQRRLDIVHKNIRAQQEMVEITRARFEAGLSSELDAIQAGGLLAATQSQIPALESSIKQAIHRIGVLLGQKPEALLFFFLCWMPNAPCMNQKIILPRANTPSR